MVFQNLTTLFDKQPRLVVYFCVCVFVGGVFLWRFVFIEQQRDIGEVVTPTTEQQTPSPTEKKEMTFDEKVEVLDLLSTASTTDSVSEDEKEKLLESMVLEEDTILIDEKLKMLESLR